MQFHGNGFRLGDPDNRPITPRGLQRSSADTAPDLVDVLIIGTGPAGLTLAAQLSAFPEIDTCIVEQNDGPLELGRADGIACRTMEMFNAFGFAERVLREAYWVNETSFWRTDPGQENGIARSGRVDDTEPGLSEFPHVIINQARIHEFLLDVMRRSGNRLEPLYRRKLIDLLVEPTGTHPVVATFLVRQADGTEVRETVRARYCVGCDGARSVVRTSLKLTLEGDSANQAWGVMDVLAVTDFPDIRLKSLINSADGGTIVLIPREGGHLVRFYVEMDKLGEQERATDRNIQVDDVIAAARRVMHPYQLDVREVAWWSVYEIGQRMCDRFDDVPDAERLHRAPRVFIAGDACHTHSPKAGQGMNVSMQDAFNLGWKLASVLKWNSPPEILSSYSGERRALAKDLIDFDREWASLLTAASKGEGRGADPAEVQSYFIRHGRYTAGTATQYAPSLLTAADTYQQLAAGFPIGQRFHSAPVIRLADARPMQLGHAMEADGRWRIMLFAPDGGETASIAAVERACAELGDDQRSPLRRFTLNGEDVDSLFDVRCVFPFPHRDLDIGDLPDLLLPSKGPLGLRDYEKIFCADHRDGQHIYDLRAIDRAAGCIVVIRPDQHVANLLQLGDVSELFRFFEPIFAVAPSHQADGAEERVMIGRDA